MPNPQIDLLNLNGYYEAIPEARHDIYHLPSYLELESERIGGEVVLPRYSEGDTHCIWPLVARPVPPALDPTGKLLDATSPYGYPAPLMWGPEAKKTDFLSRSTSAIIGALAEENIVTAFIRLHPILSTNQHFGHGSCDVVDHGETIWMDLRKSMEELRSQYRSSHRNLIRRLGRDGYTTEWDQNLTEFDSFKNIYASTMERVNANSMYFFAADYFDNLVTLLPGKVHLWVARKDGCVAAASLFTECNGILQYHLSGTNEEHLRASPTRLVIDQVAEWAQDRGNTVFHLGGGLGSQQDGLFLFKSGFSKLRARFRTLRSVALSDQYSNLVKNWRQQSDEQGCAPGDFFPTYRKPILKLRI